MSQQYAPDVINGRAYYEPSGHGMEGRFAQRARLIRQILHPEQEGSGGPVVNGPVVGGTADEGKTE